MRAKCLHPITFWNICQSTDETFQFSMPFGTFCIWLVQFYKTHLQTIKVKRKKIFDRLVYIYCKGHVIAFSQLWTMWTFFDHENVNQSELFCKQSSLYKISFSFFVESFWGSSEKNRMWTISCTFLSFVVEFLVWLAKTSRTPSRKLQRVCSFENCKHYFVPSSVVRSSLSFPISWKGTLFMGYQELQIRKWVWAQPTFCGLFQKASREQLVHVFATEKLFSCKSLFSYVNENGSEKLPSKKS